MKKFCSNKQNYTYSSWNLDNYYSVDRFLEISLVVFMELSGEYCYYNYTIEEKHYYICSVSCTIISLS